MIVAALQSLMDQHGVPASTLTDNWLVFTARPTGRPKGGSNGFGKLLEAHHIQRKNGHPGHPQTQGKIERFHQTLKRWLRARPLPVSITELPALIGEFERWYNHQRPHRSVDRRTPATEYTALPKPSPRPQLQSPSGAPAPTRSPPPAPCHCATPANRATRDQPRPRRKARADAHP